MMINNDEIPCVDCNSTVDVIFICNDCYAKDIEKARQDAINECINEIKWQLSDKGRIELREGLSKNQIELDLIPKLKELKNDE